MDKIDSISILLLQNSVEKHVIWMRQLPVVLKVRTNAVFKSLAQS